MNDRWENLKRALENPLQELADQVHEAHVDRLVEKLNTWLALQYAEDQRNDKSGK